MKCGCEFLKLAIIALRHSLLNGPVYHTHTHTMSALRTSYKLLCVFIEGRVNFDVKSGVCLYFVIFLHKSTVLIKKSMGLIVVKERIGAKLKAKNSHGKV